MGNDNRRPDEVDVRFETSLGNQSSRRVWILAPVAFAGLVASVVYRKRRTPPDPALNGSGEVILLVLFSDDGRRGESVRVGKVVKSEREWRVELSSEEYAVTRGKATEFAFHNLYWNEHGRGVYRCVCCGNAVFRSEEKFDSETGWPSFRAPAAAGNIELNTERSAGVQRVEVACRKCDAHLGHVFDDGPPPTGKRYCLNSAALQFRERT